MAAAAAKVEWIFAARCHQSSVSFEFAGKSHRIAQVCNVEIHTTTTTQFEYSRSLYVCVCVCASLTWLPSTSKVPRVVQVGDVRRRLDDVTRSVLPANCQLELAPSESSSLIVELSCATLVCKQFWKYTHQLPISLALSRSLFTNYDAPHLAFELILIYNRHNGPIEFTFHWVKIVAEI